MNSVNVCSILNQKIEEQPKIISANTCIDKVTSRALKEYNKGQVDNHENNEDILVENQFELFYQMIKRNELLQNGSLSNYLEHYAKEHSVSV